MDNGGEGCLGSGIGDGEFAGHVEEFFIMLIKSFPFGRPCAAGGLEAPDVGLATGVLGR